MNSKDRVLSLDIGTSTIKCALFDTGGIMTAQSKMGASVAGAQVLLQVIKNLKQDLGAVRAVCVSGNGPTIVPINRDGSPSGRAVLWNDPSAKRPMTGTASLFLPVLLRAMELSPDAWMYVGCPEYASGMMTGSWWTFLPSPQFEPYIWSKEDIVNYGIPDHKLPPMLPMGAEAGRVSASFAAQSGLAQGVPIFAGGADYLLALLGTGLVENGLVLDRAGTSEALNLTVDDRYVETARQCRDIRVLPHTAAGLWSAASLLPSSGMLYLQFITQEGLQKKSFSRIDAELFPGNGPWDADLDLVRRAYDLVREGKVPETPGCWQQRGRILSEALGYHLRGGLEALKKIYPGITGVRVSGGQVGSRGWNRLKADVLGVHVDIPVCADAELLGCASVSLTGLGVYPSVREASRQIYRSGEIITPDPVRSELFSRRFATLFP